jgi:hypothetical protein
MPLTEADTRAKLIDPAIHARGWTEDLIRREQTVGAMRYVACLAGLGVLLHRTLHLPSA